MTDPRIQIISLYEDHLKAHFEHPLPKMQKTKKGEVWYWINIPKSGPREEVTVACRPDGTGLCINFWIYEDHVGWLEIYARIIELLPGEVEIFFDDDPYRTITKVDALNRIKDLHPTGLEEETVDLTIPKKHIEFILSVISQGMLSYFPPEDEDSYKYLEQQLPVWRKL